MNKQELLNNADYAVNRAKLEVAYNALVDAKKLDPKVEINDETLRAEYVKRAGLVREKDGGQEAPKKRSSKKDEE